MATWPRTIIPRESEPPDPGGVLLSVTQAGNVQRREVRHAGVTWTEVYPPLLVGTPDAEALLSAIRKRANRLIPFDIDNPVSPGSGLAPNGTGTAGVTVSGAGQTGNSLVTAGWPLSTSGVTREGDWIAIAGINHRFRITDDSDSDGSGLATLSIEPRIEVGEEPANGAGVTTTGVTFRCIVQEAQLPNAIPGIYLGGVTVLFREVP